MLLVMGVFILICFTFILGGEISFKISYLKLMLRYVFLLFLNNLFFCSVILVTLSKFHLFQNYIRLSLFAGVICSLAHFWKTPLIPGTIIPVEMALTLFGGFFVAIYFLKFRTIIPITLIHAILHTLLHNWIEVYLQG